MTATEHLTFLAVGMRASASVLRQKADIHDRNATKLEVLATCDEASAQKTIDYLKSTAPEWFAN